MTQAIRDYCSSRQQPVPLSEGDLIRTILESLALSVSDGVGLVGGTLPEPDRNHPHCRWRRQNELLCQMTADACGRQVIAGPVEATAIGNVMMQAVASGDVGSIAEARDVIRRSFGVKEFQPQNTTAWDEPFDRFSRLLPS